MSMPVPHPATLGKSVTLGKSETTTVLVLVSDTVQRIVTVRYNTVLADSDTSTVPYGPAAYSYRVSVQNFTARIRNCTELRHPAVKDAPQRRGYNVICRGQCMQWRAK